MGGEETAERKGRGVECEEVKIYMPLSTEFKKYGRIVFWGVFVFIFVLYLYFLFCLFVAVLYRSQMHVLSGRRICVKAHPCFLPYPRSK